MPRSSRRARIARIGRVPRLGAAAALSALRARVRAALGVAALLVLAATAPAGAAELRVLTAGAYKPVLVELLPAFERASGHKVTLDNDTAGGLVRRIGAGEAFDLVVLTPAALQQLAPGGRVAPGPARTLARVGIGVAVLAGAPQPDIGSIEGFRAAVLQARKLAYIDPAAGGSSGVYLARLFESWGIAAQVAPKAVLVPGGLVATRLVSGEADLAIHQISEILAVPNVTLVGPLPAAVQNYTVYAGALAAGTRESAAAQALLEHLAGAQACEVLKAKGMEAP